MHYDLIIVGGGLVGAGLALALRHTNLKIALVDARLPQQDDQRLFALNQTSCHFLENIGLWPQLEKQATTIQQVHVSRRGHFGAVRLRAEEANLSSLGHVIPAKNIEAVIYPALAELNNLTSYRPATLKQLSLMQDHAELVLTAHNEEIKLSADLVIAADGTESTVRRLANIDIDTFDYQQSALVTRTMLQRSHHGIAYERFTSDGAIAMLPLPGNECATIWSAQQQKITQLQQCSAQEFTDILQTTFGYRLGKLQSNKDRFVFPLRKMQAKSAVANHVLLLGNAAHTLHPIAAQGFNLAIYEVAVLVEKIESKGKLQQQDLYEIAQHIQKQQGVIMQLSHQLAQLFHQPPNLINMIAPFCMVGLDLVTPVKRRFIDGLLGTRGCVPPLLLNGNGA